VLTAVGLPLSARSPQHDDAPCADTPLIERRSMTAVDLLGAGFLVVTIWLTREQKP
jgi:hypothetical protein